MSHSVDSGSSVGRSVGVSEQTTILSWRTLIEILLTKYNYNMNMRQRTKAKSSLDTKQLYFGDEFLNTKQVS